MKGDRRATIRKGLHELYIPHYDALCAELSEEWQPYSGLRSLKKQEELYAKGRTQQGQIVTYAPPGASAHNYGMATDWTIFNENDRAVFITKEDPIWREYEIACIKLGLNWGGFFTKTDCYHNELHLNTHWRNVKLEFDKGGMDAAVAFIKKNL